MPSAFSSREASGSKPSTKLGITREMSDDELIAVLVDNPDLLQRPIVVRGERAILARPFQEVETLL